jgi:hypothetical protein
MYHQLPVLTLSNHPIYLISGIRTYRENPISMIICIKRRNRKFGYYQSGVAKKLLLIDLSGTYDII